MIVAEGLSLLPENVAGQLISQDDSCEAGLLVGLPLVVLTTIQFLEVFSELSSNLCVNLRGGHEPLLKALRLGGFTPVDTLAKPEIKDLGNSRPRKKGFSTGLHKLYLL